MDYTSGYLAKRLYKISNAKIAIASEKIKAKIMTMNIFDEAEGLRAMDLTAEKPTTAITAAGPAVLKIITKAKANIDIYYFKPARKQLKNSSA
ncbi:MAG: hypothetical protein PHU59_01825 [Candidatus Omnitrophica bacterium]|nr:hypothetical protein [Candidatus Omnitrophota bacterium]